MNVVNTVVWEVTKEDEYQLGGVQGGLNHYEKYDQNVPEIARLCLQQNPSPPHWYLSCRGIWCHPPLPPQGQSFI